MSARTDSCRPSRRRASRRARWLRAPSRLLAVLLSSLVASLAAAQILPPSPVALPSGGKIVVGAGAIRSSGAQMSVEQSSSRLGIDWQRFDIGSAASVDFRQPSASAIALNRVVGNDASAIYGKLTANGQVFLVNPNGVLFAPGAKVDVGALVASTLDLSQSDFAAGLLKFRDTGSGASVANQGHLQAAAGGYIGLFGRQVDNGGEIAVRAGSVLLASGQAATLAISDSGLLAAVVDPGAAGQVANRGLIEAPGSTVTLTARSAEGIAASLVNHSGIVRAGSIVERNGEIILSGDQVATSGTLAADATGSLSAGRILLQADMARGRARIDGSLSASAEGGDGGFVETSAAKVTVADGARVRTTSAAGRTGTWLIDPTDYNVGGASADISGATLGTNLGGGNVVIASTAGASGSAGNVNINEAVAWSANKLTLNAKANINVNAALTGTGTASLAFEYGQGAVAAGNTASYAISVPVTLPAGAGNFTTRLGSDGTSKTFNVVTTLADLQAIDDRSGGNAAITSRLAANYALGADIDASSTASAGFNPIGLETTSSAGTLNSFSGRFDGLGHTISGLTISQPSAVAVGLIGNANNATIGNLVLSGGSVTGGSYVGAVVGIGNGSTSLENVRSATPVSSGSASSAVGGLVGQTGSGNIAASAVGGSGVPVAIANTGPSGTTYAGGLVGNQGTGSIGSSAASVNVTGSAVYAGGLVGRSAGPISGSSVDGTLQTSANGYAGGLAGAASAAVDSSSANVAVTATHASAYAGGLIGAASQAVIGSTAQGAVSGGARTGGLVGDFSGSGAIQNSSAAGTVTSSVAGASVGGLVGFASGVAGITSSSATGAVTGHATSGEVGGAVGYFALTGTTSGLTVSGNVSGGNYTGGVIGQVASNVSLGAGSIANVPAQTVSGAQYVGGLVGYSSSSGTFSGLSSSAAVTATTANAVAGGLFGRTAGPVNNSSSGAAVTSSGDAGGLIGFAQGSGALTNLTATGTVTSSAASAYVGGLVALATSGSITGGTAHGNVSGGNTVGGLVGSFAPSAGGITGSTATGSVTSTTASASVGGLVGNYASSAAMSGNSAGGNVSGGAYTGGLVGFYDSTAAITDGTFSGTSVTGGTWVGGLIGWMNQAASISGAAADNPLTVSADVTATANGGGAGGMVGRSYGSLTNVRATGNVNANVNSVQVGGLVGRASGTVGAALSNLSATGTVTSSSGSSLNVGGLIGWAEGTASLSNSTASGSVTAPANAGSVGGLVGAYEFSGAASGNIAAGAVSGGYHSGGLFGWYNSSAAITSGSYTPASITGGSFVGGIVGYMNNGSISGPSALNPWTNSTHVTGTATHTGQYPAAGGFVGHSTGSVANLKSTGNVKGNWDVGGVVGAATGTGTFTANAATGNVSSTITSGGSVGGLAGYYGLSGATSGNVSGAVVTGGDNTGGLFGYYDSAAAITDGSYTQASIVGGRNVGALIGYMNQAASISGPSAANPLTFNTDVTATVGAGNLSSAGGVVGRSLGSIANVKSTGHITGLQDVGGIVGRAEGNGTISGSTATGAVTSSTDNGGVGGLVGSYNLSGAQTGNTAAGNVSGGSVTGGMIGWYNSPASITDGTVGATATISGPGWVGGYVGYMNQSAAIAGASADSPLTVSATVNSTANAGGFAGRSYGAVSNLRATGDVTGGSSYVGGLIGQAVGGGGVADSSASGKVSSTSASGDVGGLIGYYNNSGTLSHGSASGKVSGGSSIGGLVGYADAGSISNSSATGNVSVAGTSTVYAGGLVGYSGVPITGSSAAGSVTVSTDSTAYVGGLVGYFGCWYCAMTMSASTASGAVFVDANYALTGGLVGYMYGGSIDHGTATGAVTVVDSTTPNLTGSSQSTGGLVGYFDYYTSLGSITNSSASGAVSGRYYTGGLVGQFYGSGITDSSASGAVKGTYYVGGLVGYGYSYGSLGLSNVSASGNVTGLLAGGYSTYIGGLLGYYGLSYGSALTNGFASGKVVNPATSGMTGGLAGYMDMSSAGASINDSAATGSVSGGYMVGGLAGRIYNYYGYGSIQNSHASGDVSGSSYVGGLVGYYQRYQVGNSGDDIANSYATGNVDGSNYVGGLVGYLQGAKGVRASYATGNVAGTGSNSTMYLGGLVGDFYAYSPNNASIAPGLIRTSYASGGVGVAPSVSVGNFATVYAGGLVGYLEGSSTSPIGPAIVDAYASGAVSLSNAKGSFYAGGLVGRNYYQSVDRTYASGAVSAVNGNSRTTGGLVATSTGTVTSSYWDGEATGQASSAGGGTALSTAQMKQSGSFAGWSIRNTATDHGETWRSYDGFTPPLLSAFLTPVAVSLADASKAYDGTTSFGNAAVSGLTHPERMFASLSSTDAGTYAVAASGVYSVQNGYDLSVSGSAQLTITKKTLTLDGVVADKVYDSTRAATFVGGAQPKGLAAGEDLTLDTASASATFDSKNVGQGKTVTVTGVALADGAHGKASNYTLGGASTSTASITPAPLAVGGFSAVDRVYDGSTTVAVTAAPSGTVVGKFVGDDVAVDISGVTGGTVASKNVGSAKPVTVLGALLTGTDAGNYRVAGVDGVTVNITPKALTVNGLVGNDKTYNSSTSASVTTSGATLGGAVAGDTVQLSGTSVAGSFADKNVAFDGSGTVIAKNVAVSSSVFKLRGVDAANYTVQDASTTAKINPYTTYVYAYNNGSTDKVYDGTTSANVTSYLSGYYGGDSIGFTSNAAAFSDKNVAYDGSGNPTSKTITLGSIALTGTDKANYVLGNAKDGSGNAYTTTSGTIRPKSLTVTGVSATNRSYDGTRNVEVSVGGATVDTAAVVAGDTVSVTLPGSGTVTGTIADKNVGNDKAVTVPGFSLGGADAGNYTLAGSSGVTVTITRKNLTATYAGIDKVYDGNAYAGLHVSSGDIVAGDSVGFYADAAYCTYCGYAYFATSGSIPGNYTASRDAAVGKTVVVTTNSLYGADAGNYTLLNPTGTTTATISPKPVTLVFNGANKVYDGTDAATVSLNFGGSGLYSGDTVSVSDTAVFAAGKGVGNGKTINIGSIVLSGPQAGSYSVANATATTSANITPKTVTLSGVAGVNRVYDGTVDVAVTTTGSLSANGFIAGDTVQVDPPAGGLTGGTVANKNAGNNKPVTVTGLTLSGADAGNYTLDNSVTVNIAPKPLTAAYTGVDRVYNGGVKAQVTGASTDIVSGDTVTFAQNAVFSGIDAKNVGTAKPVSVSNIALGGADAGNYALASTTATTTAGITPKSIAVGYTGVNRVYDGVADLSAQVVGSSSGIVAGDTVTFSQTAAFRTDGAAGDGKAIDVSAISLGGAQATNYALASTTASTSAAITKRPIGVAGITATNRAYDGTRTVSINTAGATIDASSVITGDVVSVVLPVGGISTGTVGTKDAGSNKEVSVTGLALTGASSGNYAVTGASGLSVNISPKSLGAVYTAADKVYDGTALATIGWTSADLLAGDVGALGLNVSGTFVAGKNVGAGKTVAVSGGYLVGVERNNYALQNPTATVAASITPRPVTATYSGDTKVYDGTAAAPVHGSAGFVAGDTVGLSQTAQFSGAGAKNVGNGKPIDVSAIALTGVDAGNYSLLNTTANAWGHVTPKAIAIQGLTGASAVNRTYDGTRTVTVNVTTSGALSPNSADIVGGDDVTINLPSGGITSGTMADKNAGSRKAVVVDGLSLSGADALNYSIAATSGITVDIARKSMTAVYAGINKVYDGTAAATAGGTSADILAGDSVSITGQGVFTAGKNVGIAKSVDIQGAFLGGVDGQNYQLANTTGITSADITRKAITPSYAGQSKVYDGTASAPVQSTTGGFVAGDDIGLTQTALFNAGKNVGSNKAVTVGAIALAGTDAGNYSLTATDAVATGSITPKALRVDGLTGVTAVDRVYDGTRTVTVNVASSGTLTPNAQDLVAGDVVGVTAPAGGVTTGTTTDKNVGIAKAVTVNGFGLNGADAGNYVVSAATGVTVAITPKSLTASYSGVDKVYDGTANANVTARSADIVAGDLVSINPKASFDAGKAVGNAKTVSITAASLSNTDAGNYALANPTGTTSASITPKTLAVSYTGTTKVYDGTTAAPVTANAAGLIAGDDVSLGQTAVFSGAGAKNVGTNKAVQVSGSALSGADAGNYTLVAQNSATTASVTPRPVTVDGLTNVTAVDRTYDGTRTVVVNVNGSGAVSAHPGDIIAGDNVTVNAPSNGQTTGTMADKTVGSHKAVVVSGLTLSGPDASNYAIVGADGVSVSITPKALTAAWTGANKVYDGSATTTVSGSSTGLVAGDVVTLAAGGVFDAGKNVGIGKALTVSGGLLGGADAGNYLLSNPGGTAVADITPRNVNAVFSGGSKVYDGTAVAPVQASAAAGLVAGDDVHLDAIAVFTGAGAKNVGNNKPVQVSNVTLTGTDAGNYNLLNTSASTTAGITPKSVTVGGLNGISAVDRVYDGTRTVTVNVAGGSGSATTSDFIAGDDVFVAGSLSGATTGLMQDKNVGAAKAVAVTGLTLGGADAGNYVVGAISGVTVNITAATLQATGLVPVNRVYDGTRDVSIDTSAASLSGKFGADVVQLSIAGTTGLMADKNAGTAKPVQIGATGLIGADAGNYTLAGVDLRVDITPKPLTARYAGVNKVYDGTTAAVVTATGTDFVAGDNVALSVSAAFTGNGAKNAGTAKPVAVSGALNGADASNYLLTTPSATLAADITPRTLNVQATVADRLYDGTTAAKTTLTDNRVVGDDLTLSSAATTFADKNVGTGKTVPVNALVLAGADAANYTLASSSLVAKASIKPAPAEVTAASKEKVYGDTLALTGTEFKANGVVAGETIEHVNLASAGLPVGAAAGSYALTPSAASGSNFDPANYLISYVDGQLSVTRRPLSVAANTVVAVAGQTAGLNFDISTNTGGLVNGDRVGSVTTRVVDENGAVADYASAAGGSVFRVRPSEAVFGSGLASNYQVSYQNGLLILLPRPPVIGETGSGGQGTGNEVFVISVAPEEIARAAEALRNAAATNGNLNPPAAGDRRPLASFGGANLPPTGSGQSSISLPELLRLPLIALDPQIRRLIFGTE